MSRRAPMRLPAELYREVMHHLSPQELAPLLLCNRFLRLEAARLAFRDIDLRRHKNAEDARALSFERICRSVGGYVHRLDIHIQNRYLAIVPNILRSLPNLEELTIRWEYVASSFDRFVPPNLPFKLHTLIIRHTSSSSMTRFINSQRLSLRHFDNEHASNLAPPFSFPALRVLGASVPLALQVLEQGTIKCFKCVSSSIRRYNLHNPVTSVRSVELSIHDNDPSTLPNVFPNVRYMQQLMLNGFERFVDRFPPLPLLEKLRLSIPPRYIKHPFDSAAYRHQVTPLFQKFPKLFCVCISSPILNPPRLNSWVYGRDSEEMFIIEDYEEAMDEWARYEDDNYQTRA